MKLDWNRKYTTIAVYAFLVIAASILFASVVDTMPPLSKYLQTAGNLLIPFVIGGAIAYVLNPVLNWIERKLFPLIFGRFVKRKTRRALGVLLSFVFLFAVLGIFGLIVLPQIYDSIMSLVGQSSQYIQEIRDFIDYLINTYGENPLVMEVLTEISTEAETLFRQGYNLLSNLVPKISTTVATLVISITNGLFDITMGLIISVYVLLSKETFAAQIKKLLTAAFDADAVETVLSIAHDSNDIFCGFISGKIVDSFIIGVLCFVGTTLMNTPYAILVSVIVGVTNVIPYFGPFIGAIPSILLILLADPIHALYFSIFVLVLQQLDGNVIGPKILGDSTGLSAFWVVFSVTFFGGMFGFIGMLIGVPTFAVIYGLIRRLAEYGLNQKGLATNTSAYASAQHPLINETKKPKKQKGK